MGLDARGHGLSHRRHLPIRREELKHALILFRHGMIDGGAGQTAMLMVAQ